MENTHDLKDWPLFSWDSDRLAPLLARLRYSQGLFAHLCEGLDKSARQEAASIALRSDASCGAALSGQSLSPRAVEKSGIFQIMADIHKKPEKLLTAARILGWHKKLVPGSPAAGQWRAKPLYTAPAPRCLPEEITLFLAWFNFGSLPARRARPSALWQDPVIRAAIAQFWFLSLQPFEQGSARLARAVGSLALLRADPGKACYSLDERALRGRENYLAALAACQGSLNITPWLEWYLLALEKAVQGAQKLIAPALKRAKTLDLMRQSALNSRQRLVLGLLLEDGKGKISSGSYAKAAGCSTDSALRDIQELMERGLLRKNKAGGRSTSYSLKN